MRWGTAVLACVMAAAGTSVTGCARYVACGEEGKRPSGLTASDLVGTYEGKPFGRLTLAADGTFTAQDWPDPGAFEITGSSPRIAAGHGTWTLEPETHFEDLDLHFATLGTQHNYGAGYSVAGSRQEPRVYRFAGDPDVCKFHIFRRKPPEQPPQPPNRGSEPKHTPRDETLFESAFGALLPGQQQWVRGFRSLVSREAGVLPWPGARSRN